MEAILPYALPQLDGAELADGVWQTAMSWFSTGDVMTSNMLDRFQANLNQEVSHAAQSQKVCLALLSSGLLERDAVQAA